MDNYFGLIGREYIKAVLSPLFQNSMFEQELCFDLRNEAEDQALNRGRFTKVLVMIVEGTFSFESLDKIPPEIRLEIWRHIKGH